MEQKCGRFSKNWRQKMMVCLAFFGFLEVNSQAQILKPPPDIIVPPVGISVQNGGTAIFTATATSLSPMTIDWLFNGKPVSATNTTVVTLLGVSTLTVNNISPAGQGTYSIVASNKYGSVTNSATLVVLLNTVSNVLNILSTGTGMTANGFQIHLSGPVGSNYVIQASSDLKNWVPISTNAAPTGSVSYTDAAATNLSFRYYRAIIQ
jgi:Immunoglobulin I-set domain